MATQYSPSLNIGLESNSIYEPLNRTYVMLFWMMAIPIGLVSFTLFLAGLKFEGACLAGAFVLAMMLASPLVSICVFYAWQAWDGIFLTSKQGVFTPSKAMVIVVLLSFMLHYSKMKPVSKDTRLVLLVGCLFGIYGIATASMAPFPLVSVRYAAQVVILSLLTYWTVKIITTREQIRLVLWWLVVGTMIAAVATITMGASRQYTRSTLGEFSNPNTTALALSIGLAAVPALWGFAKRKYEYLLCAFCGAIIMAGMMKTGSRSACGGIVIGYAIGGLMVKGKGWGVKILATMLAIMFAGGVFLVVLDMGILDDKSQSRLEAMIGQRVGTGSDAGSGRVQVWLNGIEAMFQFNPITGVGYGNTASAGALTTGYGKDIHSSLFAPLVEGGLIGATLMWTFFLLLYRLVRKIGIPNPGIPAAIMFAYLMIACVTHTIHFTKWFWIMCTVSMLCAQYSTHLKEEEPLQQYS